MCGFAKFSHKQKWSNIFGMFHSKYSYEYLSMFRVQIPVDTCPTFALKRRSFLFVIDSKKAHRKMCFLAGGEGWIRTTEVTDNRFTVCSLWPLGNLSVWSWWLESNQQPTDYKSVALPVELHQRIELLVPRGGLEPPTQGFSVPCSTTWATEAFGISIPLF